MKKFRALLVAMCLAIGCSTAMAKLPWIVRAEIGTKPGNHRFARGMSFGGMVGIKAVKGLETGIEMSYYTSHLGSSNQIAELYRPNGSRIMTGGYAFTREGKDQSLFTAGVYAFYDFFSLIPGCEKHHFGPTLTFGYNRFQKRETYRGFSDNMDETVYLKVKNEANATISLGARYEFSINKNWGVGIYYRANMEDEKCLSIMGLSVTKSF